jgi:hypothetical protein
MNKNKLLIDNPNSNEASCYEGLTILLEEIRESKIPKERIFFLYFTYMADFARTLMKAENIQASINSKLN